ncbi:MAG: hypothetical protein RLN90_12475 [Balneolaceae bacterium]
MTISKNTSLKSIKEVPLYWRSRSFLVILFSLFLIFISQILSAQTIWIDSLNIEGNEFENSYDKVANKARIPDLKDSDYRLDIRYFIGPLFFGGDRAFVIAQFDKNSVKVTTGLFRYKKILRWWRLKIKDKKVKTYTLNKFFERSDSLNLVVLLSIPDEKETERKMIEILNETNSPSINRFGISSLVAGIGKPTDQPNFYLYIKLDDKFKNHVRYASPCFFSEDFPTIPELDAFCKFIQL